MSLLGPPSQKNSTGDLRLSSSPEQGFQCEQAFQVLKKLSKNSVTDTPQQISHQIQTMLMLGDSLQSEGQTTREFGEL